MRDDKEVVLAAVNHQGAALREASDRLRNDPDVALAAVLQDAKALRYAGDAMKRDRDVVLEAVGRHGRALEHAAESLKQDQEIVLAAVRQDGLALEHAGEALRDDVSVVRTAVMQNVRALRHASERVRSNRYVLLAAFYSAEDGRLVTNNLASSASATLDTLQKMSSDTVGIVRALEQSIVQLTVAIVLVSKKSATSAREEEEPVVVVRQQATTDAGEAGCEAGKEEEPLATMPLSAVKATPAALFSQVAEKLNKPMYGIRLVLPGQQGQDPKFVMVTSPQDPKFAAFLANYKPEEEE